MGRKRENNKTLVNTRIYRKRQRYYFFSNTEIVNPKTGKLAKWHSLCNIKEGELKARNLANEIISYNSQAPSQGDMPRHLTSYIGSYLAKREKKRPTDKERIKMFEAGSRNYQTINNVIAKAFFEYDVADVEPVDIAQFLDRYETKKRMAQVYRSHLSSFFKYACRKGYRADNPVDNVTVDMPEKRKIYIVDDVFIQIREALLIDKKGKLIPTGDMMQCYVDLCYLMYQRLTEIRLLEKISIKPEGVKFQPTKTEHSSNADVIIQITEEIQATLDRAFALNPESKYVIYKKNGEPFTASGLRSAWNRACERVGISGLTLKDLRPKSLTDASNAGFKIEQISIGAAHTDKETTKGYIKIKPTPISEVNLKLPKK